MKKRAASISVSKLSGQIDKAVKKLKLSSALGEDLVVGPQIMGRVLIDEQVTVQDAREIAANVAGEVGSLGAVKPGVLITDGVVICGLLPPPEFSITEK